MSLSHMLEQLAAHGGPRWEPAGVALLRASLQAAAARLQVGDRALLARSLPAQLGRPQAPATPAPEPTLDAIAAEVARATGLEVGHALEQFEVAWGVLAAALGDEARALLAQHAPEPLCAALRPEALAHPTIRPRRGRSVPPHPRTLASGREGSAHPLSEAAPDRAQSGSVARWDGSRTESTLGGYHGDARERESETLATGAPGSSRPLKDAK